MQNSTQQTLDHLNGAQTGVLACTWTLFGVTTIIFLLRFAAQLRVSRKFNVDDILLTIAWALQISSAILCTIALSWGLGQHASELYNPIVHKNALKYQLYTTTTSTLCAMFGRIALATLLSYYALRSSTSRHLFIWSMVVVQLIFNIIPIALSWVRCSPIFSHPWTDINSELCYIAPGIVGWYYAQGAINAASDLSLSLLPLVVIVRLKPRACLGVSVGILLTFSLLAMVAVIVRTVEVKQSRGSGRDFLYSINRWNYWYSVENAVLIIYASFAKIKEFARIFYKNRDNPLDPTTPTQERGVSMGYNIGFRTLHSRTNSDSRSKSPTRIPTNQTNQTITTSTTSAATTTTTASREPESRISTTPQPSRKSSTQISLSPPRSPTPSKSHHRSRQEHSHPHSRKPSDSPSFISLPRNPLHNAHSYTKPSTTSERPFHRPISCDDFTSALHTCRTVISAGDGPHIPVSFSLPGSGRNSTEVRRESTSRQSLSVACGAGEAPSTPSPVLATGYPFYIVKTNNFTVEYEDADHTNENATRQSSSQTVDMGWSTMRNESSSAAENSYKEHEADELQLQDVGSILNPSQEHV